MNSEKYIGLDVHQATISIAVMDSTGKVVMESILETKAATILEFFEGLRGTLSVTFEEGTWAAWLYDVLKPHVDTLVVCNPWCQYRTSHPRGAGAVEMCSLETWALFRGGPGRAKACARPAGPKSRALETDASRLKRRLHGA